MKFRLFSQWRSDETRAYSGPAALGVDPSLIAHFELGDVLPSRHHLKAMAKTVGITLDEAEEILRLYQMQRSRRSRRGRSAEDLLDEMAQACARGRTVPIGTS
jgi:hypothetical protein